MTGRYFFRFWIAIHRRTAFDDVGDINTAAVQIDDFKHGIKKFASRSDKRFTLQIFLFAGTFAYEHDFGRGISDAENQFVTHCAERTVSTLTALLFKFVPIDHEGHLNR